MKRADDSSNSVEIQKVRNALAAGDIATADIVSRELVNTGRASEQGLRLRLDVLSRMKDFQGAVAVIARLIELTGESRDLFFEGAYYSELGGNLDLAVKGYEKVLESQPEDVLALLGLGRCLLNSVGVGGAELVFARAYELEPENQEAAEYLALAYEKEYDFTKGIPFCEGAIEKFPQSWMLQVVLGNLWSDSGKSAKGLIFVSRAIKMQPEHQKPLVSAASLLKKMCRPFEALDFIERARKIAPGDFNILLEEAALLRAIGRSRESIEILEKVLKYIPDLAEARSNYVYFMHDINGISRDKIYSESVRYNQEICSGIKPVATTYDNDRSPDRPLNVGFLSSDFREHSVAYFLLPLLQAMDKNNFRLHLFSSNVRDDDYTGKFRSLDAEFYDVRDTGDEELAGLIRKQKIDVLFELSGHTSDSRLKVCTYKAAPIQVNWLGYPDTTGLDSIDYRIVDGVTDPVEEADRFASERLVRMKKCFLCYQPHEDSPEISSLPMLENSYVTFGSFSNMAKINPDMIALWSRLLLDNPDSRLVLKNKALGEELGRRVISERFQAHGVAEDRILLLGATDTAREHLELYSRIDIALDTFPYNGTTTIFEALYMGVPVVGLCGVTHASRVGASILSSAGLKQLVGSTPQEYLKIASALARQRDDLVNLRTGMRQRLAESGLLDEERFADELSELIRGFWNSWIETGEE